LHRSSAKARKFASTFLEALKHVLELLNSKLEAKSWRLRVGGRKLEDECKTFALGMFRMFQGAFKRKKKCSASHGSLEHHAQELHERPRQILLLGLSWNS
jgi:hypothetical protein